MITKISGCDQMWCPECKNAWSWSKGVIVYGYIHNPHYFEYQKKMGNLRRNPNDIPCGGMPAQWLYIRYIKTNPMYYKNFHDAQLFNDFLINLNRYYYHFYYTMYIKLKIILIIKIMIMIVLNMSWIL